MRQLLTTRGVDLYRSKGVLSFEGEDHPYVFQAVHMLMGGAIDEQKRIDVANPSNILVFIGKNLVREELTGGFMACTLDV